MTGDGIDAMNDEGLLALLGWLDRQDYDFVPTAPASHANRLRHGRLPPRCDARQILGWSRVFDPAQIDRALLAHLDAAGILTESEGGLRATIRVSRLAGTLLCHSAYPTTDADAVFLGPDSYRYVRLVQRHLPGCRQGGRHVDIGTGSGAAAIIVARACPDAQVTGTDINPRALRLARINAAHAGVAVDLVQCAGLDGVRGEFDLVMSNPPFMIDPEARLYRNGGEMFGLGLGLALVDAALDRLTPGGRLVLFTGNPIIEGRDILHAELSRRAAARGLLLDYDELDPDVYGEELLRPAYADVERIALAGAMLARPGPSQP